VSLQVLADQLGFAIREAQLYDRAAQAKARAERSDRSKTQLLANVSHELRTPLNVILGYTQRALDSFLPYHAALPAALVTDLERIHHSSEHLLHMANDLLDLSRAEIQELELFPRLIEPRPLLAEAFQSLAEAAPAGLTCWRLELPDHLPLLKADPVRLRQIVFNLLSNAQRFTDQGHITLGAEVAPPHLHLWVQDTGLGIPLDRHEQIFEPFVTAQHGDRQREGTGLGLSIVHQLVTLHQGTLTLESQPGEGSTFHIYLPLPGIEAEATPLPTLSKRVLLLVSDKNQAPAEVTRYCQRQGLRLRPVGLTESLNQLLAEVQPAALAWNLACAQPDYKALIERLCSHPALCRLPFMVYGAGLAETKTKSLGLTNFMLKPVEANALLQAVEAMQPATARSVLIVDDDPAMRTYLSQVLAQACLGFEIHTAEDGAAALVQMTHALPDLVILDLKMPGLDGFQVLESMRSQAKTSRTPVLVMTGQSLTMQDVKRLEHYALVTVHSKGLLTADELAAAVHHSLFGADTLPPQTSALAKRAIAYFHEHYAEPLTRKEVAQAIGVSQNYLSQIFRQELGLSPWDYLTRYRIKQAEQLLSGTTESIAAIANRVGFGDPAYFSRVFHAETGTSPSAFRNN
jgi:AraC-like DNA-binding protein/nitrogen-specific signal transduction histidine kinase